MATQNEEKANPTDRIMSFDDTVEFTVKYPKEHNKKRHIPDGQTIELHRLQAEDWEARGLGKMGKSVKKS